ncbi:unnamed protein product [Hymenolepis diminuta]|uniref:F-box domain-containing protein n=1 Tax=Hymenolepis diminuta TaxID=6216 RepID=A0A564Z6R5_HYMDI|nr:unnamed protein product [Hymenolepis diminuta]
MGKSALLFCDNITEGNIDFLSRMPPPIIKKILSFVNAEGISNLACCCKKISEICSQDNTWGDVYRRDSKESLNK